MINAQIFELSTNLGTLTGQTVAGGTVHIVDTQTQQDAVVSSINNVQSSESVIPQRLNINAGGFITFNNQVAAGIFVPVGTYRVVIRNSAGNIMSNVVINALGLWQPAGTWAGSVVVTNTTTAALLTLMVLSGDPASPVDGNVWRTSAGLRGKVGTAVGTFTFVADP